MWIYSDRFGGGYNGEPSIFDNIGKDDLIMAFFPCTRFEDQIMLMFRGQHKSQGNATDRDRLERSMLLHTELHDMYMNISMLASICIDRGLQLIIENPYSAQHYLRQYWCIRPAFIDKDRTQRGDIYRKPTQYFFINCTPKFNFIFEAPKQIERKRIKREAHNAAERSMISKEYANRFIREFILEGESTRINEQIPQQENNSRWNYF